MVMGAHRQLGRLRHQRKGVPKQYRLESPGPFEFGQQSCCRDTKREPAHLHVGAVVTAHTAQEDRNAHHPCGAHCPGLKVRSIILRDITHRDDAASGKVGKGYRPRWAKQRLAVSQRHGFKVRQPATIRGRGLGSQVRQSPGRSAGLTSAKDRSTDLTPPLCDAFWLLPAPVQRLA